MIVPFHTCVVRPPFLFLLLLGATAACTALDATSYGPPGGLEGKKLPIPSGRADAGSGGPTALDDAGPNGPGPLDGAAESAVPGAPCGVSWATQLFPQMASTGAWRCADSVSCHGGPQSPTMSDDPGFTYRVLTGYTMKLAPQALPYVMVGATDPAQSGIHCNLAGGTCGVEMPLRANGARTLTAAELQLLDTWLACGAPDN